SHYRVRHQSHSLNAEAQVNYTNVSRTGKALKGAWLPEPYFFAWWLFQVTAMRYASATLEE
ncbi:Hypothetical predicted protein, partial [Podarcis lilfordi]